MFLVISERGEFLRQWSARLASCVPDENRGLGLAEALLIAGRERISLAIVDASSCGTGPLSADILQLARLTRTLLAQVNFSPERELQALSAGIVGCCGPELSETELRRIIDVVQKGGIWVGRQTLPHLLHQLSKSLGHMPGVAVQSVGDALHQLTPREREVALLMADGENNKTIANRLKVSDVTVKSHVTTIFRKLGVSSRTQVAVKLNAVRSAAQPLQSPPLSPT